MLTHLARATLEAKPYFVQRRGIEYTQRSTIRTMRLPLPASRSASALVMRKVAGSGSSRTGRVEVPVKNVRIHVGAVRPHDRPQLLVDLYPPEELWVRSMRRGVEEPDTTDPLARRMDASERQALRVTVCNKEGGLTSVARNRFSSNKNLIWIVTKRALLKMLL